ncbi:MAG: class I SAM-dependent methyltransferase [Kiritimatiellia bacterium]
MSATDVFTHESEIRNTIRSKPALTMLYREFYGYYLEMISKCPPKGLLVELGSGAGFAKEIVPNLITTDILDYQGVDRVVDAAAMPFDNKSVSFIGMTNVFHHLTDVSRFLHEADRVLIPNGRTLMIDQHNGIISRPVLRYLHHEPYNTAARTWALTSSGSSPGANGALAWIVFKRDLPVFEENFPRLKLISYQTHTPLRYWLCGGLRRWNALPACAYRPVCRLERLLLSISENFGSFCNVEIIKEAS